MDRPALLVLVRHGQSVRNVAKKGNIFFIDDESRRSVRGIPDHRIPLTPEGERQARATGAGLAEHVGSFDVIYHSGYERTRATAEGILGAFPEEQRATTRTHANLFIREREAGWTYDMTTEEAEAAFPYMREYWQTTGSFFARPPGGESLAEVVERVHTFMDILIRDHKGERVMVVTHGGTLRCFRFLLEGWDYERADTHLEDDAPLNCSVTTYTYSRARQHLQLQEYNRVFWR